MREAVLLVGGQGTRLRPLTLSTPKPMLNVAGVPFLTHQLVKLRDAGVTHVVLATSYRPEVFSGHYGDGSSLGVELTYVEEREPLGTGGAIGHAAPRLRGEPDDPVVVLNGDVLSGHDLAGQVSHHVATGADVTLHLVKVADPRPFGCVPCDHDGRVLAFLEKSPEPVTDWVNAGAYVFRRALLDTIPGDRPVSVERETFPALLAAGSQVRAWKEAAYWLDVGTPEAYVRACADLVTGTAPAAAVPDHVGPALVTAGAVVQSSAVVDGGSYVGPHALVADGAVVRGAVVMAGAQIGERSLIERSVIGSGAVVEADAVVVDSVVGDHARIASDNELRHGARVWPGVDLPPCSVRFSTDA